MTVDDKNLREKLSALLHEMWSNWANSILMNPSAKEVARARTLCALPFSELTEDQKDKDRVLADRVLELVSRESQKQATEWKEAKL